MGLQRSMRPARAGLNRKRTLIGASLIATGGVILVTALPASAHTNESSASCSGVIGKATGYSAIDTNAITVSIDGAVVFSSTFAQSIEHVAPVAVDGNSHTWSVVIDSSDNRWDNTVGGDVGPCGPPPTTLPPTTVPVTTLPPTTVPETTLPPTTVPETTLPPTTVPETTLPPTTVPETTLPPTTVPDSSDPTTTDVSPSSEVTTTTLVSDEGGTTTTVSPSGGGQLPRTGGSGVGAQVALAAALMCAGVALLAIGRRRPQQG